MLLTVGVTLLVVGAAAYFLVGGQVRAREIATYLTIQRADGHSLERVGHIAGSATAAEGVFDQVVRTIAARPGIVEASLIDPQGVVVASPSRAIDGTEDLDAATAVVLAHGTTHAGRDSARGRVGDYEFIVPVNLTFGRYAFRTVFDHRTLDGQLSDLRGMLGLMWLLAVVAGSVAFYLLGGRGLLRSHRIALQRATRDGLTDLPNLGAFRDELSSGIALAARHGEPFSLVALDVDDFKLVNDRDGHPEGDALLRHVADVLRKGRAGDGAFRIGGDEFAVLLPKTDAEGARIQARRLLHMLVEAGARASLGVSAMAHDVSSEALRAHADAAMYEAKRQGGNRVLHFDDIDYAVAVASADKRQAVIRLIDEGRLETVFQPIWDLRKGTLLGIEALTRPDPAYGFSGPAEAYDVAEQIGRVRALDVLCATNALRLGAQLPPGALLFINLSPQTLDLDSNGNDWFAAAVKRAQLSADRVVIEVTERFGGRTEAVVKSLNHLRAQGFKLALDDVGTGNAGLEMLRQVDPDYVKLDRSIVIAATSEPTSRAVLMAIATFASRTGAYVIAEGIEDQESLDFLNRIGERHPTPEDLIRGGQGYGLGRPSSDIDPAPPQLIPRTPTPVSRHPKHTAEPTQPLHSAPDADWDSAKAAAERDHAAAERDHAAASRDHAAADRDQSQADADRRSSSRDQAGVDRALAAAERDHAAADRDQSEAETEQRSLSRDNAAANRDHLAADSDQVATEREQSQAERHRAAADRDHLAADRDQSEQEADDQAAAYRAHLTTDRSQSEAQAEQRSSDRDHAAADRDQTADDRIHTAADRSQAHADRALAAADRAHTAADRDQSEADAEQRASGREHAAADRNHSAADNDQTALDRDLSQAEAKQRFSDREHATTDRERATADRDGAAADRLAAVHDREDGKAELRRAQVDQLTGALGRQLGIAALEHQIYRAHHGNGRLVLAFVDVDGLNEVNSRRGHAAGDGLLRDVVLAIKTHLPSDDSVVRVGGDEFVCALGDSVPNDARRRFQEIATTIEQTQAGASISVGFAALRPEDSLELLTQRAETARYEAKPAR
jgi:diguanylate cyclase (GGDEF)-like protein